MSKTIICPKCSHVRPPDATNPEWQCPACGVCYARADERPAAMAAHPAAAQTHVKQGWDWGPLLKIVLFVLVGWGINKGVIYMRGGDMSGVFTPATWEQRLQTATAGAKPTDIMLYSAPWCGYCKDAKATFEANNVPYTDCNTEGDWRCKRDFDALHGTGFPLFVVRGQRLHEGLNYEAVIAAMNEKPAQ
jgi:glutaredoxin